MPGWAVALASIILAVTLTAHRLDIYFKNRRRGRKDGIEEISKPGNPKFDVVTVHGLGAHPDFSWTSKISKKELEGDLAEWEALSAPIKAALRKVAYGFGEDQKTQRISLLHHVLKPEFPEATILNFCYNSDWFVNAPIVTAKQIGTRLVDNLEKVRSNKLSTPIIFIGHSFGGIVIKQALVAARETGKNDIVNRTRAVVFLGTPHIGSRLSAVVAATAFVSGIFGSDTTLLYALRYGSEQLYELEERFRHLIKSQKDRGGNIEIVSFRETMQTYILGWLAVGLVVDASSALGCASMTIPLDVNHTALVKSPKVYKSLTDEIRNLTFESKPILNPIQRKVQKILAPLGNAIFDPEREESEECETVCDPDTRVTLLKRIKEWATNAEGKCMFWLQGKAGTGKSTISRTMVRDLIQEEQCIASFYFRRNTDCANSGQLFPTIANQLNRRLPSISQHLLGNINSTDATSPVAEWNRENQFKKLILEPLAKIDDSEKPRTIVVVIDAFDECDRRDDVEKILRVLPEVKQLCFINVKVLLTSRPENYIRNAVGDRYCWEVTALDEEPSTKDDISTFVRSRLEKIRDRSNQETAPKSRKLPDNWPGEDRTTRLVELTQPLFIYASTACRFIQDPHLSGTLDERLEKILKREMVDYKSQISASYRLVLEQIAYELTGTDRDESIKEAKKIIGAIIVSARPLSAESLATLLRTKIEIVDKVLNFLHSVLNVPPDPKTPVTLFYQPFRDFLLDSKFAGEFCINQNEIHKTLYSNCLTIMKDWEEDLCNQRKPGTLRENVDEKIITRYLKPEVQYACLHWVNHLQKSGSNIYDGDPVHKFLKNHFLHWLEALSWLRKVSDGIQFIIILESIAKKRKSTDLSALLLDMKRFACYNRPAIELAPLQVYSSALVLVPAKCRVRMQFVDMRPGWIQRLQGTSELYNETLHTLQWHDQSVRAIAFSQDGKYMASTSTDGVISLWKVEPAAVVSIRQFHGYLGLLDFTYSLNGKRLASSSRSGGFRLWDSESGKVLGNFRSSEFRVNAIAFSPCSDQLALASSDDVVRLWNESGKEVGTLDGTCSFTTVTFSDDGERLAAGSEDGSISLWACKSREWIRTVKGDKWVNIIAFSQDSKWLVSASRRSEDIWLWDGKSGAEVATLKGHTRRVQAVSFSPDSKRLASASIDSTIILWNSESGARLRKLGVTRFSIENITFSQDSKWLALAFSDGTVELWDHELGVNLKKFRSSGPATHAFTFSPDNRWLAFASTDGIVRLWDYDMKPDTASIEHHSQRITKVAFSSCGEWLASASNDYDIKLWDHNLGVVLKTLKGHGEAVTDIAFSSDDKWLASCSFDDTIRLWDSKLRLKESSISCYKAFKLPEEERGLVEGSCSDRSPFLKTVVFSPDDKRLASGSTDGSFRLWDIESGSLVATFVRPLKSLDLVAFSPDGEQLASYDKFDMTIGLWDIKNQKAIYPLNTVDMIPRLFSSSDGSYVKRKRDFIRLGWASSSDSKSRSEQECFDLSVSDKWIAIGQDKFFYLPVDFRPTSVAIKGRNIALGHESGRVSLFRFDVLSPNGLISLHASG